MKVLIERYDSGWKSVAVFDNEIEGVRCLPAIGRILQCSVRCRPQSWWDDIDLGIEPLPRGVIRDLHRDSQKVERQVLVFSTHKQ